MAGRRAGSLIVFFGLALALCLSHGRGGASAAAARPTPEARLREAMARKSKTVLKLISDVILTADLGEVACPNLTIVGDCKTKGGQRRLCKIDGRSRFGGFGLPGTALTLTNLEIAGLNGFVVSSPPEASVVISNCLLSRNRVSKNEDALFGLPFGSLLMKKTKVVKNKGTFVSVFFGSLTLEDVLFQSNEGTIFRLSKTDLHCTRCGFEKNSASSSVVVSPGREFLFFYRSWFTKNAVTAVGQRGGVVSVGTGGFARFCNCRFQDNTVAIAGGKRRIEHVYVYELIPGQPSPTVVFCKKRPSAGIGLESPKLASHVRDSNCRC